MGRRKALPPDFDGKWTEDMLSVREREILDFIREYNAEHGYPPAIRDIGKAVGFSSSASVHNHVKHLAEIGMIVKDSAKPRAMQLADVKKTVMVDVVDRPGGNVIDRLPMPEVLINRTGDIFIYRENLGHRKYGIASGDYVVCCIMDKINDGDIVAVGSRKFLPKLGRYVQGAGEFFIEYDDSTVSYSFAEGLNLQIYGVVTGHFHAVI